MPGCHWYGAFFSRLVESCWYKFRVTNCLAGIGLLGKTKATRKWRWRRSHWRYQRAAWVYQKEEFLKNSEFEICLLRISSFFVALCRLLLAQSDAMAQLLPYFGSQIWIFWKSTRCIAQGYFLQAAQSFRGSLKDGVALAPIRAVYRTVWASFVIGITAVFTKQKSPIDECV